MRKSLATVGVLALMVSTVAACSSNEGGKDEGTKDFEVKPAVISKDAKDSEGPASEVKGAQTGGEATYLAPTTFDHLDPRQTYYVNTLEIGRLFSRQLTSYRVMGEETKVVGDLATGPGKDLGDCKAWEYELKDGLKYEDGSPIKADDIAYAISSTFDSRLQDGPSSYFRGWLKGAEKYKGPFKDKGSRAPGIKVDGDNKITFELSSPHCDLPYMAAMSVTSPLPEKKEAKNPADYDFKPFSSGPYKFEGKWSENKGVTLVKNENWDPKTDPIRHQYVDTFKVNFGDNHKATTDALRADKGADATSMTDTVDINQVPEIVKDKELMKRVENVPGIFVYWMGINNMKIKDPDVRKALAYAVDKEAIVKATGGSSQATPASTTLSPTVAGYEDQMDMYKGPKGDKKKAKELLKGKDVKSLTYAYRASPANKKIASSLQDQLKEVGIELKIKELSETEAPSILSDPQENKYDLYMKNWGADWPTGYSVLQPIYDGRTITDDPGNVNNIWFDEKEVNDQIDKVMNMTDPEEQNKAYMDLDKKILEEYMPMVPLYYSKTFAMHGSKVGGLYSTNTTGTTSFTDVFVKS
ncbi:ABC transporter substrate-binding protein [Stackebrandtia nassauensis]|uniref:Extracellular solute-binding protein family 5 n=1 Tax=Stackebrandtia nassauensis (strain DSM 44728 / CIP 108903 / NRRL B-16338 / NBRC 102104 / LLR-40K-21) TaxID=446470 RepID=D3PW17_STANL|nr:ABC transporter substrate-binding protein [Stackebrandtia nassauensis]ADD45138.1 extracellular solute-binding protein family 5 [Stackebrandtia nassauensis DSM 44728]